MTESICTRLEHAALCVCVCVRRTALDDERAGSRRSFYTPVSTLALVLVVASLFRSCGGMQTAVLSLAMCEPGACAGWG